jgi:hypothetical protein
VDRSGGEGARPLHAASLGGERSRPGERACEPGEDRQIGTEPNPLDPAPWSGSNAHSCRKRPNPARPRHGYGRATSTPSTRARHQEVKTARLDPSGTGGAVPGRAPPLGPRMPCVGTGEPPLAMLSDGRLVVATLHTGRLTERDDRPGVRPVTRSPRVSRPGFAGATAFARRTRELQRLRERLHRFVHDVDERERVGQSTAQRSAPAWC